MKLLVFGSRSITDAKFIKNGFDVAVRFFQTTYEKQITTVIHGGASGVDTICGNIASNLGFEVLEFRPDYKNYPANYAPLQRNLVMAEQCDVAVGFWDNMSKGTKHMKASLAERNKEVLWFIRWEPFDDDGI